MRPPMPYFGSKQTLAPWIVSLLSRHTHYVEPYAGSLAVLLAKPRSRIETVNDLDQRLVTFWRVLRDRPDELIRACALTPHSRTEYVLSHEPATDELEVARRVWACLTQSRSGRGTEAGKTGWRHHTAGRSDATTGGTVSVAARLDAFRRRLPAAAERLMGVSLECMPALEVVDKYGAHPTTLLYVDPPYLGSTRNITTRYQCDMPHEHEHRELAAVLADCRAAVVLSGYDSPLYGELYEGWHRYETAAQTGNATGDRSRTEVLWSNRPLGGQGSLFGEQVAS